MAKVIPFRGLRYDFCRSGTALSVMARSYDILSPGLQDDLYHRAPHNIGRHILGRTCPADSERENFYSQAATEFSARQQEGILLRDPEPSIYLYDQAYALEDGTSVVTTGFMALARLEDFASGVVKPHQQTLAAATADRFNLIKACSANFSPIFSLYSDPCCVIESLSRKEKERSPEVDVVDADGVKHRLWRTVSPEIAANAKELLDKKPLFIAEGHHRYEAALDFRNLQREQHPGFSGRELFNYILMYFANMDNQGLQILPVHRGVHGLDSFRLEPMLAALAEFFTVESQLLDPADSDQLRRARQALAEKGKAGQVLGCYAGEGRFYYLSLKDVAALDPFFDAQAPKVLRTLDCSILHRLILQHILRLDPAAQEQQVNLTYLRRFEQPFALVDRGECQLAFLLNPTRMNEVRDVANAGVKMPPKSTFFYPKLLSGLVINQIFPGETVGE